MQKYNIEDNIDFYSELNKLLNEEKSINKEEENICLISNEKLTTNFVKLNCGHCFNYIPLYIDLVNQKQKFNQKKHIFFFFNYQPNTFNKIIFFESISFYSI